MEVYVLDEALYKDEDGIVDDYISMIWTERFWEYGDFELTIHSSPSYRALFTPGKMLSINQSKRVMRIENVENNDDSEGRLVLKVTGRSLEAVLTERVNRSVFASGATVPSERVITATPPSVMRQIFDPICRTNSVIPTDNIPFLNAGSLYPASTIPEPIDPITYAVPLGNVYDPINEIASAYGIGFRLTLAPAGNKLYFDVYMGDDRTSSQSTFPAVIFSPDMDTLTEISEFTTNSDERNVAYVTSKNGSLIVYASGADVTTSGFDKKIVVVEVDSDLPSGSDLNALLDRKGREELAKYRPLIGFDGEVPQTSQYVYDRDYRLGDLVEMRNFDGVINKMRVTEQIIVSDAEGVRSYPTLALYTFITPGSWFSWGANKVWNDATTEVWYDI